MRWIFWVKTQFLQYWLQFPTLAISAHFEPCLGKWGQGKETLRAETSGRRRKSWERK